MTNPASQAIEAAKRAIRSENRRRINAMDLAARAAADADIRKALSEWSPIRGKGVVCGFLPLPGEPDLRPVLRDFLNQGMRIGVPEVVPSPEPTLRILEVMTASDLDTTMASHLGTRVPSAGRVLRSEEVSTVLVPGMAFDRRGGRIGRGRGFFDAFLHSVKGHACSIGVAYEVQIVPKVPFDAHDEPVDCLCTERGIVRVG